MSLEVFFALFFARLVPLWPLAMVASLIGSDALITTQKKNPALYKVPFREKSRKIARNDHFSKITIFCGFAWFFREMKGMRPRRELGFFLCFNQCIKALHLSYKTLPYKDFHFLAYNGFLEFFRPLVAAVQRKIFILKKYF